MRRLAFLISLLLLAGCKTNSIPPRQSESSSPVSTLALQQQKTITDTPSEFLLTSAATDFHSHHSARTISFRNVRLGGSLDQAGKKQFMLCGEFLPTQSNGKADWMPFVTIKTSGYEQYLGTQAASFCRAPSVTWDEADLSSSLQRRFDSLK